MDEQLEMNVVMRKNENEVCRQLYNLYYPLGRSAEQVLDEEVEDAEDAEDELINWENEPSLDAQKAEQGDTAEDCEAQADDEDEEELYQEVQLDMQE